MSIDTALIKGFSAAVHQNAQQEVSRTTPFVEYRPFTGEQMFYDSIGQLEARKANGRSTVGVPSDQPWGRRLIGKNRYYIDLEVDKKDVREVLMDPESELVKQCRKEFARVKDREIVNAALASVYTGKDGTTLVTAANDGVQTVNATAGFTYEKLLEVTQGFIDDEVGNDMRALHGLCVAGDEHTKFMGETELTSGDFSSQYAVDKGLLVRVLNMQLVLFGGSHAGKVFANPILPEASGLRACVAIAKGGVCLGMDKDLSIEVFDVPQKIETKLIRATMTIGAVRTEGKLVKRINTTITS